jgi:hypothetical protein
MELGIRLRFVNISEFRGGGLNPPRYATGTVNIYTQTVHRIQSMEYI